MLCVYTVYVYMFRAGTTPAATHQPDYQSSIDVCHQVLQCFPQLALLCASSVAFQETQDVKSQTRLV